MDLFDALDVGTHARRVGRLVALAAALLVLGWVLEWPVAHDIVQHVLDGRVAQAMEIFVKDS